MKFIPLSQGKQAIIDDEYFEKISQYKWFARKGRNTYYAYTSIGRGKKRKRLDLHHLIMGKPKKGMVIDHKDRNGLNCQQYNLRKCTIAQNSSNRTGWGESKYLGVSVARNGKYINWRAYISINKKPTYIGFFRTQDEAALAYNEAAIKHYGEFANLNKIVKPIKAYQEKIIDGILCWRETLDSEWIPISQVGLTKMITKLKTEIERLNHKLEIKNQ